MLRTAAQELSHYVDVGQPVATLIRDYPRDMRLPLHFHRRHQLVFAAAGIMAVSTEAGAWIVPTDRVVWMPAMAEHDIRMITDVAMRSIYLDPAACTHLPNVCRVMAVTPLLRELILRASTLPADHPPDGPEARLMAVILDEIARLPTLPLDLPSARDPRVARLCQAIRREPADKRTLDEWAPEVGASRRTLARLFVSETGLTFAEWRRRARLAEAITRLSGGQSIATVAYDLGYDSPSAFTAMFKAVLGSPPSRYVRP